MVFANPEDPRGLGIGAGALVDLHSEWTDGVDRVVRDFRVVSYPTARGCAAAYFPEAIGLVPLDSTAVGSNIPTSKAIILRLETGGRSRWRGRSSTAWVTLADRDTWRLAWCMVRRMTSCIALSCGRSDVALTR